MDNHSKFSQLTAKWIYENYTKHIDTDEPLHIYDSSSGWGGRIIGAMSSRKKIHYIGTDPNPDNFIDDLGISRYEYVVNSTMINVLMIIQINLHHFLMLKNKVILTNYFKMVRN